jgi:hypothetical protein
MPWLNLCQKCKVLGELVLGLRGIGFDFEHEFSLLLFLFLEFEVGESIVLFLDVEFLQVQPDVVDAVFNLFEFLGVEFVVVVGEEGKWIKNLIFALGCYFTGTLSEPEQ